MEITCPECGSVLLLDRTPEGVPVQCARCGAVFHISPKPRRHSREEVIDVHAEPVSSGFTDAADSDVADAGERVPPDDYGPESRGQGIHVAHDATDGTGRIYIQRKVVVKNAGQGCNGCGCLLIALLFLLLLRGCI